MPAKKAPSAKLTPNNRAAPRATPRAMASTASRNSSREPVWATAWSSHGIALRPIINMAATNAPTFARVMPISMTSSAGEALAAMTGRSTSAKTMITSSTINHPIAILPRSVSSNRHSCMARNRTTVEATDRARPKVRPAPMLHPMATAKSHPRPIATAI